MITTSQNERSVEQYFILIHACDNFGVSIAFTVATPDPIEIALT